LQNNLFIKNDSSGLIYFSNIKKNASITYVDIDNIKKFTINLTINNDLKNIFLEDILNSDSSKLYFKNQSTRISITFINPCLIYDKTSNVYISNQSSNVCEIDNNIIKYPFLTSKIIITNKTITLTINNEHNAWYYFNFKKNILRTLSSNDKYNSYIKSKSIKLYRKFNCILSTELDYKIFTYNN